MSKGGRIVNVCSMAGKQRILNSGGLLQQFQVLPDGMYKGVPSLL